MVRGCTKRSLPNSRLRKGTIYRDYCFVLLLYSCQKWGGFKHQLDYKTSLLSSTGPGSLLSVFGQLTIILPASFYILPCRPLAVDKHTWSFTPLSLRTAICGYIGSSVSRTSIPSGDLDHALHRVILVAFINEIHR
jgi:hypothetical protein